MFKVNLFHACLLLFLFATVPANAGWLEDKLEEAGRMVGDRFIRDTSDVTDERTKNGSAEVVEGNMLEPELKASDQENLEYEGEGAAAGAKTQAVKVAANGSATRSVRSDLHFSADTEMLDPESSPEPLTGKMFVDGARMRWDMSNAEGHMSTIITGADPDDKIYTVMHGRKMYMVSTVAMAEGDYWASMRRVDNPCEGYRQAKKLGQDSHDGRKVTQWQCSGPEDQEEPASVTHWVDSMLGIPIRTEASDGSRFVLKNIRTGKPPADQFKLPAGYRQFTWEQ